MDSQLPLPNQVKDHIVVAKIECDNKFGKYTTEVFARPGQSVAEAIDARVLDLRSRNNTIISIRRISNPYENQKRLLPKRKER